MVIRDHYPALLKSYIRARAAALHTPWPLLAEQVGLSKMNIADIQGLITTQRQSLIRSEYDYATSRYAIFDGSPNYVWEGEIIRELRGLDVFKDFDGLGSDACAK